MTEPATKPTLVPQAHGGALLTGGVPGHDGSNAGRPPLAFKNFVAKMRSDPAVQQELENTLKDRESKNYPAALRVIVDYDEDLPSNMSPEQRKKRVLEIVREASKRKQA